MKIYHVKVVRDGDWYAAQALEDPAIITQGRSLDEVVYMVRDAAHLLYKERQVQVELILPANLRVRHRRSATPRKRRSA